MQGWSAGGLMYQGDLEPRQDSGRYIHTQSRECACMCVRVGVGLNGGCAGTLAGAKQRRNL